MNDKLTPEKITAAAFRAWSGSIHTDKSLSAVARELGITKPALYRYFKNKADLERSLEETFIKVFRDEVIDTLEAPEGTLKAIVREYTRVVATFFSAHPDYFAFLAGRTMKRHRSMPDRLDDLWVEQIQRIHNLLTVEMPEDEQAILYIITATMFWTSTPFRHRILMKEGVTKFEPVGVIEGNVTDRAVETILRGCIHNPIPENEIDLVERVSWIDQDEMLEPDRIITAIESVVLEVGYGEATIERIASALGMTKSSLYFYFKNKNEMIGSMILREMHHFLQLLRRRFQFLDTSAQRLYSLLIMSASYTMNHPAWSTVQTWLQYNRIEIKLKPEQKRELVRFVRSLREIVTKADLVIPGNSGEREGFEILGFINVLVRQLLIRNPELKSSEEIMPELHLLYRYLIFGICPARRR